MTFYKQRRLKRHHFGLEIAPMIDVVFLLLIFFVSTSKLYGLYSSVKVENIPKSRFVSELSEGLILSVLKDKSLALSGRKLSLESLENELRSERAKGNLIIVSDKDVELGFIISLIGIAKASGFREVNLGAVRDDS